MLPFVGYILRDTFPSYTKYPWLVDERDDRVSDSLPLSLELAAWRGGAAVLTRLSLMTSHYAPVSCQTTVKCALIYDTLTSRARDSVHSFISGINNKGSSPMNCPLAAHFLLSDTNQNTNYVLPKHAALIA